MGRSDATNVQPSETTKNYAVRIGFRMALILLFLVVHLRRDSEGQVEEVAIPSANDSAALEHFRTGVMSLQSGDADKAIRELEKAILIRPDTDEYHAAISAAYLAKKNPGFAWDSARRAFALGPKNVRVAEQLALAWTAVGSQGLFVVGTKAQEIRKVLGKPDRVNRKGGNERWIYGCKAVDFAKGLLFSTIDLRGYKPELQQSAIRLSFRPDPERWSVTHRDVSRFASTTEYKMNLASDAPEVTLLTQRLFGQVAQGASPRKWMEQARRQSAPPGTALDWTVLGEDKFGLTYEWSLPKIESFPGHWELTRVLKGARDLHRISYISEKSADASLTSQWKTRLAKLRLVKRKQ